MDTLIRLAANAVPKERRYVLLAGAGVSKDAGQPTSWDILMETARLLRAAEGGNQTQPIEEWFLSSRHAGESYASMIEALHPNPAEQQAFLERVLHVRKPGRAHEAIAELARREVLGAIIVLNFDDLLERALREKGLDVQIVASDADWERVSPLIHCHQFRVYKPHGTLGLGTIRNTPADIAILPATLTGELQHVLDDHGMLVVGYGAQDAGFMNVLVHRRRNLYPVYWMHIDEHAPAAATEALGETLVSVRISGAGTALGNLLQIQDRLARISETGAMVDSEPAIAAVIAGRQDVTARVRDFMREVTEAIARIAPRPDELDTRRNPEADEVFIRALAATEPIVLEFAKVANASAEHNSVDSCTTLREALHRMDHLHEAERAVTVSDFVHFLTQEMFVMLFAGIIQNDRWQLVGPTLNHLCLDSRRQPRSFFNFNSFVRILDEYRKRRLKLNRTSVAADLYEHRHSGDTALANASPCDSLVAADFFLTFVTGYLSPAGEPSRNKWLPRVSLSTSGVPDWLARMRSTVHAYKVLSFIEMEPKDIEDRVRFFLEHFDDVRQINKQTWPHSNIRSPGDFDRSLRDELFSRP